MASVTRGTNHADQLRKCEPAYIVAIGGSAGFLLPLIHFLSDVAK